MPSPTCPLAILPCRSHFDVQVFWTARGAEDEGALLADDECRTEGSESLPHGIGAWVFPSFLKTRAKVHAACTSEARCGVRVPC